MNVRMNESIISLVFVHKNWRTIVSLVLCYYLLLLHQSIACWNIVCFKCRFSYSSLCSVTKERASLAPITILLSLLFNGSLLSWFTSSSSSFSVDNQSTSIIFYYYLPSEMFSLSQTFFIEGIRFRVKVIILVCSCHQRKKSW